MKLPKAVSAYTWECDFGLCRWAEPSMDRLSQHGTFKPTPKAKIVAVRIVKLSDWRKIDAELKDRKIVGKKS